ncbi:hypothetical protein OOU_Y34scaffold00552g90 [Pyricularia oryzae Y34]|uniref:Uncharacterized protein n=3 Tax=Pyricularia oryzae TaxID=318829 RepID=A0A4P7NC72_PYROR|nr:hypothetical protein OOU_Y34scaffold00552g90 [Pyricularia oryzae Y34]QBZ58010.1 hypothetical protein PoMZ_02949 [Pyricularia oryzae]
MASSFAPSCFSRYNNGQLSSSRQFIPREGERRKVKFRSICKI